MADELFFGNALNTVDQKNRLSIPADYRAVILANTSGKELRLGPSRTADCLVGYDKSYFARLLAQHDARFENDVSREADDAATSAFGDVLPLTIDDAGRIVLPGSLKQAGFIKNHVWFIAGGRFFEAWNPWRYLARADLPPRRLAGLRFELESRGLDPDREPVS